MECLIRIVVNPYVMWSWLGRLNVRDTEQIVRPGTQTRAGLRSCNRSFAAGAPLGDRLTVSRSIGATTRNRSAPTRVAAFVLSHFDSSTAKGPEANRRAASPLRCGVAGGDAIAADVPASRVRRRGPTHQSRWRWHNCDSGKWSPELGRCPDSAHILRRCRAGPPQADRSVARAPRYPAS